MATEPSVPSSSDETAPREDGKDPTNSEGEDGIREDGGREDDGGDSLKDEPPAKKQKSEC